MRFGISATSSIFPKDLRTRLRPVNVCAIVASFFLRPARMGGGVFQAAKKPDRKMIRAAELIPPTSCWARSSERPFAGAAEPGCPNADNPNANNGARDERGPANLYSSRIAHHHTRRDDQSGHLGD